MTYAEALQSRSARRLEAANRLLEALRESLDECQAKKRAESEREQVTQQLSTRENWIPFLGGRIFNDFETWTRNNFDPEG